MDQLPADEKQRLEGALVRSLNGDELRRAFGVAVAGLIHELRLVNSTVADRIEPALRELAGARPFPGPGALGH